MTAKQAAERRAEQDLGIVRSSQELFGRRAHHFDSLTEQYRSLNDTIKALEEEKKTVQKELQQYFIDSGCKTVLSDSSRVTLVENQGRSTIDKMRLLEHGVSAQIIAECTVQGAPFQYVKITGVK